MHTLPLHVRILLFVNISALFCATFATKHIVVSIAQQSLTLLHNNQVLKTYTSQFAPALAMFPIVTARHWANIELMQKLVHKNRLG